uniref:Uncharacterized protein n=1 Tax=Timema genevievae TaxID=629358 RepID=A0A7R9JTB9_TIMGE|nr:unnamed protein product [Timema genevievae]
MFTNAITIGYVSHQHDDWRIKRLMQENELATSLHSSLGIGRDEEGSILEVISHLREWRMGNHIGKAIFNGRDLDSSPDRPVFSRLVQTESDALNHLATEAFFLVTVMPRTKTSDAPGRRNAQFGNPWISVNMYKLSGGKVKRGNINSWSSRVGLQFPVGKIHRLLKELVGAIAPVYFTAIMEN